MFKLYNGKFAYNYNFDNRNNCDCYEFTKLGYTKKTSR